MQVGEVDRDLMLQLMMGNMMYLRSAADAEREAEKREEEMLKMAIEESKREADPNNPNVDDMTYEELL